MTDFEIELIKYGLFTVGGGGFGVFISILIRGHFANIRGLVKRIDGDAEKGKKERKEMRRDVDKNSHDITAIKEDMRDVKGDMRDMRDAFLSQSGTNTEMLSGVMLARKDIVEVAGLIKKAMKIKNKKTKSPK